MLDRLPRLTADHSAGAPISRDDHAWLIMQVWQLRAQLADAEASLAELADDCGDQCNHTTTLVDGPSRCVYDKGHTSPHSFQETPGPAADLTGQCHMWRDLHDSDSRCQYSVGHPGPHSFDESVRCTSYRDDPWFTRCVFNAGHDGTHSYVHHVQCIPRGTEGLTECTYEPGHRSPHSFEVDAKDIRPAGKGQRRCETRAGGARRCSREYDHTGPCMLQT